jgi:hypothetical protein
MAQEVFAPMHDEDIRPGLSAPFHEDEIMERSVLTQV